MRTDGTQRGQATMANSVPVVLPSDQTVNTSTQSLGNVVDASNSTTTPLTGNGVFTGAWVDILGYSSVCLTTLSDKDGSFSIQFSSNGSTVLHSHSYNVTANVSKEVQVNRHGRYYRVVYTNGAVAQTSFALHSNVNVISTGGSVVEADEIITASDNAIVTKSVLTGRKNDGTGFADVKTTPDGGIVINQNIQIDPTNSSTSNINAGATFTGATASNITVTSIQIMFEADQNCTIYIDQSQDGVNFDITDSYNFYYSIGNFGTIVTAAGAYYRVRVTNNGSAATTVFRLQTIIVPIFLPVPRSLDQNGYFQVANKGAIDDHGFQEYNTSLGERLAVPVYRLIGGTFDDSVLDTNFWTASAGTGGTVAPVNGEMTLSTGTTANNTTSLVSVRTARFTEGQTNKFRIKMQLSDTGTANNTRRWGLFTAADGTFFELSGTTLRLVTRKASSDTQVNNGSFNGILGSTITLETTLSHTWEIEIIPDKVFFFYDGYLIHTSSFASTWAGTMNLPIRIENNNSGGSTTNVSLNTSVAACLKLGIPQTQPTSKYQSGTTAGVVCKYSAGNLQGLVISGVVNNAVVTLYDNTAASGTVIWSSGAMGAQTIPFEIDMKNLPFSIGLTLVISGANCNVLAIYE